MGESDVPKECWRPTAEQVRAVIDEFEELNRGDKEYGICWCATRAGLNSNVFNGLPRLCAWLSDGSTWSATVYPFGVFDDYGTRGRARRHNQRRTFLAFLLAWIEAGDL